MATPTTDTPSQAQKRGFGFGSAVTTLAIVTLLVWIAALFVPAGRRHRFEDFSENYVTWVVFYGPPEGETP